jgi:hypothetical protein
MAEELGKIDRPEVEQYITKRKLYLVPLIFLGKEAPAEYEEMYNYYWQQVNEHVTKLELKLGSIKHIYHETLTSSDQEELKIIEKLNPPCYRIITERIQNGAIFEATEDKELTEECLDWERCLIMGFISHKVASMVSEYYLEASRKRYEHIAQRIDESLLDNEVGIIFIQEGHRVQFQSDIEVFSVAPPVLDDIHRWQRNRRASVQNGEQ